MTDAKEYGKALFLLAEELGTEDRIKDDFNLAVNAIGDSEEYLELLDTPALSKEHRHKLLDSAFGSLDINLLNTMRILLDNRMFYGIFDAKAGFDSAYDESRGIERVDAISAIPLSESQIQALKAKLEKLTNKQIIIRNTVDSSILGGIKLRYMGIQLDGSLKTKLENLEKSIKNTIV